MLCDDLSFEHGDGAHTSLKAILEGGIEGRPDNVVFYATSNRRHLTPRDMMENERSTAIHPAEVVEQKVSLSDRFGLWLGFHGCDQPTYLAIVDGYAAHFGLPLEPEALRSRALAWQMAPRCPLGARRLAVHRRSGGSARMRARSAGRTGNRSAPIQIG